MNTNNQSPPPFFLAPGWRSYEDFPWLVWAAGWIAVLKAVVWVFFEPVEFNSILYWKCLVFSLPFLIFASGVWNLKRWAIIGLAVLASLDLLILISGVIPDESLLASVEFIQRPREQGGIGLLYVVVFACGRLGDLGIIAATSFILRYRKEWEAGKWMEIALPYEHDGMRQLMAAIYLFLFIVIAYSIRSVL